MMIIIIIIMNTFKKWEMPCIRVPGKLSIVDSQMCLMYRYLAHRELHLHLSLEIRARWTLQKQKSSVTNRKEQKEQKWWNVELLKKKLSL
jgi:hypothetical protein